MSSFLEGFAISYLPKVFQDAIDVARELGLSYLGTSGLMRFASFSGAMAIRTGLCNRVA